MRAVPRRGVRRVPPCRSVCGRVSVSSARAGDGNFIAAQPGANANATRRARVESSAPTSRVWSATQRDATRSTPSRVGARQIAHTRASSPIPALARSSLVARRSSLSLSLPLALRGRVSRGSRDAVAPTSSRVVLPPCRRATFPSIGLKDAERGYRSRPPDCRGVGRRRRRRDTRIE